jgi:pimeloyl-ACP methyl ester carboxylesterase
MLPETHYAKSGEIHIAYQVVGEGPLDLVYVPGWVSHVELAWEEPTLARFLGRLSSFARLIMFDKRGTGLSDRVSEDKLPTLVIHRTGDRDVRVEEGRWLAERVPQARFVELPGDDHFPWVGDQDAVLDEIQEFLTGVRPAPEVDRVLAILLFTDMVGSTDLVARLGDRAWKEFLERHHSLVRKELDRFRGH